MAQIKSFLFLFLLWGLILPLSAQNEHGILPIHVYGTAEYGGQQQIFDIKVDSRGVVYASNRSGLMELSGNRWKVFKIKDEVQVRAIDIDSFGRIFVGGDGEFGYFSGDSLGRGHLVYHSLSDLISQSDFVDFGSIITVICNDNKVYFHSDNTIFVWNYERLKIHHSKTRFLDLFILSDQVVSTLEKKGYFLVGQDSLISIYETSSSGLSLFSTTFDSSSDLIYSDRTGIRLASIQNKRLVFGKKIPSFFDGHVDVKVLNLLRLSERSFSVATNKGVYIFDNDGHLLRIINKNHGLKSDIVNSQSIDQNNTLWVGTENGLAKINILSLYESFPPKRCNYSGRIEDIQRFNGVINIITVSGLYQLKQNIERFDGKHQEFSTLSQQSLSKFSRLRKAKPTSKRKTIQDTLFDELENPCWDLELFSMDGDTQLLISSNNYLISLGSSGIPNKVTKCYPYCSFQSKVDPRRVYIGLDGGFQSVYYTENGEWIDEGLIDGVNAIVLDIEEDQSGNLWLSTNTQGVLYIEKLKFVNHRNSQAHILNLKKGLIMVDPLRILNLNNKLLFASSIGIYDFSWSDTSFTLNSELNEKPINENLFIHRLSKDYNQNLWAVIIDGESKVTTVNYTRPTNDSSFEVQSIFAIKDEVVNSFEHDKNGITWYGGTFGLCKTTNSTINTKKPKYYTYLTTVLNNNDTIFGGFFQDEKGVISISQPISFVKTYPYSHNSFTFYYSSSSPNDYGVLRYSWYLEGYEQELDWSPYASNNYKEYTNLNEGHYIFHVRAMDVYGNISEETTFEFNIEPPWYRTIWAYLSILVFFISFVWVAIRVSTRGLKKIIKSATAEIMEQKDLLEEKNRNIMDSIRYAQRIQEAVTPSDTRFLKYFKDSFILWKPRDIVSGDFYWLSQKDDKVFLAAADCTGHGVPGAFMSIMGISFLNQIVALPEVKSAADTLNHLRSNIITALNKEQNDTSNKDGMDIALCVFDFNKLTVDYAGAYNSLYLFRDGELLETKADRMPIGVHDRDSIPFKNNSIKLKSGDQLYIFSDGYIDQFGGPKEKKFMTKRFKKLLGEITKLSMQEQKERLWEIITDWRGEIEQVDDIIIIGIRIE